MYVFMPILTRFLHIYAYVRLLDDLNGIESSINSSMDFSYFETRLRLGLIIKIRFQHSMTSNILFKHTDLILVLYVSAKS